MQSILAAVAVLTSCLVTPALAQHTGRAHPHGHEATAAQHSPYAAMQSRAIKALSAQEIEGLRHGRGMGMAMPAELNGYPGPMHVLELAAPLQLSAAQLARTKALYAEMHEAAKAQGEQVIAAERALDGLFAQKKATAAAVGTAVSEAAAARGRLREIHLRYHLTMMDVLTPEQVAAYGSLRGY